MPPKESSPNTPRPPKELLVNFEDLVPMNDPKCQHEFMPDNSPVDIPGTHNEICIKDGCPVGRIVADL